MSNYFSIPIDQIEIGQRERRDFGDLESLKLSMQAEGQLQPIVVEKISDTSYLLLAGERRLRAAIELGWPNIDGCLKEHLDPLTRLEIEAAENFHRKDFTWQEKTSLIEKLHLAKIEQFGEAVPGRFNTGWSLRDTAKILNISVGSVQQHLQLALGIKQYPELAKELTARSAVAKIRTRRINKGHVNLTKDSLRSLVQESYVLEDFNKSYAKVPKDSVSLVITDLSNQPIANVGRIKDLLTLTGEAYLFCTYEEISRLMNEARSIGLVTEQAPYVLHYKNEDMHEVFMWCSRSTARPFELPHMLSLNRDDDAIHTKDKPRELLTRIVGALKEKTKLIFDPFSFGGRLVEVGLHHKIPVLGWCHVPAIYEKAVDKLVEVMS